MTLTRGLARCLRRVSWLVTRAIDWLADELTAVLDLVTGFVLQCAGWSVDAEDGLAFRYGEHERFAAIRALAVGNIHIELRAIVLQRNSGGYYGKNELNRANTSGWTYESCACHRWRR